MIFLFTVHGTSYSRIFSYQIPYLIPATALIGPPIGHSGRLPGGRQANICIPQSGRVANQPQHVQYRTGQYLCPSIRQSGQPITGRLVQDRPIFVSLNQAEWPTNHRTFSIGQANICIPQSGRVANYTTFMLLSWPMGTQHDFRYQNVQARFNLDLNTIFPQFFNTFVFLSF